MIRALEAFHKLFQKQKTSTYWGLGSSRSRGSAHGADACFILSGDLELVLSTLDETAHCEVRLLQDLPGGTHPADAGGLFHL